jgi:ATP-dependent exoDNAse (exonuclease V) alpha subunit
MEIVIFIGIIGFIIYLSSDKNSHKAKYENPNNYTRLHHKKIRLNEKQIDIDDLKLSEEQQETFDTIENQSKNFFITGKAGTGKSSLLQYFKYKSKKRLVVVAPTGVAALNVGGQTIHSLFCIPPTFLSKEKLNDLRVYPKTKFLLRNIDTVVIDEISMVRADLMDAIDYVLRIARENDLPFGGVQIVMFGDLYQLPPVISDPELHRYFSHNFGGHYFFNSDVWKEALLEIRELTQIFRQKDDKFKNMLDKIRCGNTSEEMLNELNQRANFPVPNEGVITLAPTNNSANSINSSHLSRIDKRLYTYKALIDGELEKASFPTEEFLKLKEGAQVMLLKNDKQKRWVNGTLGFVKSLSESEVKIDIDGITYSVPKETWNKIRYYYNQSERTVDEEVISSFTQYPLKLAWAITIHKSQGQTYNSVAVDMGNGAFAHGQTYVAISRCRELETLYLKREIFREDIIVDPAIVEFMKLVKITKGI